ncbi:bifunctional 4-hydroxy-2-oxoglutarate aldolase/2-dehydro-3-deoxy-phosphogluconate aldolase [Membranihabitans marinus]|uniref:bifunctional 4-hydroxy-2-oxoglutarate aldolase/2-dehydro-3-deoxy-phosphogluconate aldolase n=1 Tax=Membranihabitans marinus TaxID=1227546 RepID=UPI001F3BA51B|nr:bifunctional 4-hydroxy-2-oxoglutarate aldolase/2-dehydro-3-deoxy-phosphogluconate aldolase [Membranihabitans marinus]
MQFNWSLFNRSPIVGIMRNISSEDIQPIAAQYLAAGLSTLEVTFNSPNVEEQIATLITEYGHELNIGAGTVCSMEELDRALDVGAQFIVTPILNPEVVKACVKANIPIFPGAFSPTEIYQAWTLGADMVKVFPADTLGPNYIKNIKGPLNNIKILATGGIHIHNIDSYRSVGVQGFGMGSELFDKDLIRQKDWQGLKNHFLRFAQLFEI